jgi:hypothetical protein
MEDKIIRQIDVEKTKSKEGPTYILYPFGYLNQRSFHGSFHMPII